MTAKEMYNKANSYPIVMAGADVVFSKKEFEQFISQLCKEQRELCYENATTIEREIDRDSILNAKQPEV